MKTNSRFVLSLTAALLWIQLTTLYGFQVSHSSIRSCPRTPTCYAMASVDTNKKPPTIIPVTLLSGFLGTGKTSLLKNLLENKNEMKIGVIVNDVASVNIDARLISNQQTTDDSDMIELQNGCACCSLSDELVTAVEKLVQGRALDSIVVELSGVADPSALVSLWTQPQLRSLAKLSTVVTLIDSATFASDYVTWDVAGERPEWVEPGDQCTANQKVSELLAEQVEAADIIVINKVDISTPEQVTIATALVKALNEKATVVQAEFGKIAPGLILGKSAAPKEQGATDSHSHSSHSHDHSCADPDCTDPQHDHSTAACTEPGCNDPTHAHSHSHNHDDTSISTADLGITSFVFRATKPFHLDRLMNVLDQWPIPLKDTIDLGVLQDPHANSYSESETVPTKASPFIGVLRSKGFCWFAPDNWTSDVFRHDIAMYWSHAGRQFDVTASGKWYATLPPSELKAYFRGNEAEYRRIMRSEFGDRRQEIVFIGTGFNEREITATLDSCLLTEREMGDYRQKLEEHLLTVHDSIDV